MERRRNECGEWVFWFLWSSRLHSSTTWRSVQYKMQCARHIWRGVAFTLFHFDGWLMFYVSHVCIGMAGATSWDARPVYASVDSSRRNNNMIRYQYTHASSSRPTHAAAACRRRISWCVASKERPIRRASVGWHAAWITNFPVRFGKYNRFKGVRICVTNREQRGQCVFFFNSRKIP